MNLRDKVFLDKDRLDQSPQTYVTRVVPPLTSLRFFAAFYVVLYHTMPFALPAQEKEHFLFTHVLSLGYVSVSFFFVLSGYILSVSYLTRRTPLIRFWKARFARIYPLYLLTLFLDFPLYFVSLHKAVGLAPAIKLVVEQLLGNVFMLQAWIQAYRGLDWPNWSLSVEALFYALFPFALSVVRKLRLRFLIVGGISLYLSGIILVWAAMHTQLSLDALKFEPWLHVHTFLCGVLLGASRFRVRTLPSMAPALLGIAIIGFAGISYYSPLLPLPIIHDGLLIPVFCCLIMAFDCGNDLFDPILSPKWLVLLGEASYALYLLHIPIWHFVYRMKLDHSLAFYPVYLGITIATSIFSYRRIEIPLRKLISGRSVSAVLVAE